MTRQFQLPSRSLWQPAFAGGCEAIAIGRRAALDAIALLSPKPFNVGVHLPDLSTEGALLAEIVLTRPGDFPVAL